METLNDEAEAVVDVGATARRAAGVKGPVEIQSLARRHTRTAIRALVEIMRSANATPAARASAANAILDRGWGKVAQPLESGENSVLQLIRKIERTIVHPGNAGNADPDDSEPA